MGKFGLSNPFHCSSRPVFIQQQNWITQKVQKQVHLSCCGYVLAHACHIEDPTFPDKSKVLAAKDTNIQSILFGSPLSQLTVPSHRTMEAFIAFNWYRCDTKPNLEIAKHVVMAAKVSGDTTTFKKFTSLLTPFLLVRLSHNGSAAYVELIL